LVSIAKIIKNRIEFTWESCIIDKEGNPDRKGGAAAPPIYLKNSGGET